MILGFFFFYWTIRANSGYVTTYNTQVDLANPSIGNDFGLDDLPALYPHDSFYLVDYGYSTEHGVLMDVNDVLTVSYPIQSGELFNNNPVVIFNASPGTGTFWVVSVSELGGQATYKDNIRPMVVYVFLASSQIQNETLSTTTTLTHYEGVYTIWSYFCAGVGFSSLAAVLILHSARANQRH